jgi:hypothetical protein
LVIIDAHHHTVDHGHRTLRTPSQRRMSALVVTQFMPELHCAFPAMPT